MSARCTHEVLPLTAPIASTCDDCGRLMPYVPASFGEPIVLTEHGAYAQSEYDRLVAVDKTALLALEPGNEFLLDFEEVRCGECDALLVFGPNGWEDSEDGPAPCEATVSGLHRPTPVGDPS